MKLNLHNKLEITANGKKYIFFNTMLKSVKGALENKESYNDYLAVGDGLFTNGASAVSFAKENGKLLSHLKSYKTEIEFLQNDVTTGSDIYVKKTAIISDSSLFGKKLTEAGITNSSKSSPTIFNYFSLISENNPDGILIESTSPIVISVYIYLNLSKTGQGLFTGGENKFINFLLGLGLEDSIYACRGNNLADNSAVIFREKFDSEKFENQKVLCDFESVINEDGLTLNFSANLGSGEVFEVVLFVGDTPFARLSVLEQKSEIEKTVNLMPKTNHVIDCGENVKEIVSVTNVSKNVAETDFFASKYAKSFADKISLPFFGLFSAETPRFLSKDGKMIFFILDDKIYGYKNSNLKITKLNTGKINISNITNIVSFDDFVFIFARSHPHIFCYKIVGDDFVSCEININDFEHHNLLENAFKIDITLAKNGTFMLGFIAGETHFGYTLYYTFNESQNKFVFDSYNVSEYDFNYLLAMIKNNFCDACLMFVKGAESVYDARLVYFYPDKTFQDIYTTMAVYFTENTREIYTKSNAVIIEKTTEPYIWVYFFPQLYRYTLSLFGNEENDYISTNIRYLIQKMGKADYKIYNLVGYDFPVAFTYGFDEIVDQSKILDFEFLDDTLLIFMDDEKEPIIAYNLLLNSMLIENVSSNEDTYLVKLKKYNLVGQNNEGVIVKFTINVNV